MWQIPIKDTRLLPWLQSELTTKWFPKPASYYAGLETTTYRALVELAQDAINFMNFTQLLAGDAKSELCEALHTTHIMLQDGLYLRAARPKAVTTQESVGWHREGMYGANEYEHNFWMPVHGVTPANAPRYIPGSDKLADNEIELAYGERDPNVKSIKLGLLSLPFDIVGGVDLNTAQPFDVPYGSAMLFPGMLIHGAAENQTDQIRFSVDFRVVAKERIKAGREKDYVDLL